MLCYGIRYLLYKIASYHLLVLIDVRKPWGRNETDSCRQAALTKLVEQLHSAFCSISAFGQIWPLLEFDRKPQRSIGGLFLELICGGNHFHTGYGKPTETTNLWHYYIDLIFTSNWKVF